MRAVVVLLALMGCPKESETEPVKYGPEHPDLICPEGTHPAGEIPPAGFRAWCHSPNPAGTWFREGTELTFHPNGQMATKGTFVSDRRGGPHTAWWPNGALQAEGEYTAGSKTGHWVNYHDNGERSSEGTMVDGKEDGAWVYWSEDGTIRIEGQWVNGARDGVWLDYNIADESPITERKYSRGRLIKQSEL